MFLLPVQMVGCSHETSDTATVGRLRLDAAALHVWLLALQRDRVPAVIVSTCHRTELYWSGDHDLLPWFEAHVLSRIDGPVQFDHRDADLAIRHLFSVAAGMCSARYGEPEILRQVRMAWTTAQALGTTDSLLDVVFRRAIEAARHIRLAIGADADASLGTRVRELVLARQAAHVLVVGAGDAARGVAEALRDAPGLRVALTSRNDARAADLGSSTLTTVVPWDARHAAIAAADVVVFAVPSGAPVFDSGAISATNARTVRPLWIDLGVPAAIEPHMVPSEVDLVGLDLLAPHSQRNVVRDRRAHTALQRELARFAADSQRRRIGSRITALEERAASVARAAVQAGDGAWSADAADVVARRVTRALLREISELSA